MSQPVDVAYAAGLKDGSDINADVLKSLAHENRVLRCLVAGLIVAAFVEFLWLSKS